jgi:hypothetical protein
MVRRVPAICAAWLVLAAPTTAAAGSSFDDPYALPGAPRPPTLPELTHPDLEASLETTAGYLASSPTIPDPGYAYVHRITLEAPLGPRRWFVGTTYELVTGATPSSGGLEAVSGNAELYGRTVWATRTGLAFGGGLGLMAPIANFDAGSPADTVATAGASLRPWDVAFFTAHNLGVRPFFDVRDVSDRFVVQFRQGLDAYIDATDMGKRRLSAIVGIYTGYRIGEWVSPGLEAFELYVLDATGADDKSRTHLVVSPSVRVMTPYVQPAFSFFTNVGPTLTTFADRVWGVRIGITLVYDPTIKAMKWNGPEQTGR